MKNELIPFNFEEKEVRVVVIDGIEWWVARDVAAALGYKNTNDAIQTHCDGVAKRYPIADVMGRTQEARIIHMPAEWRRAGSVPIPSEKGSPIWGPLARFVASDVGDALGIADVRTTGGAQEGGEA